MPRQLSAAAITELAERFRALSEPARLAILNALRTGEQTVGELVEATGQAQANVSRHLAVLHGAGFVSRRRDGAFVRYTVCDPEVYQLCDLMRGRIERDAEALARAVG